MYPTNSHHKDIIHQYTLQIQTYIIHITLIHKLPTSTPICVFETVQLSYKIGPSKLIIGVPAQMATKTPAKLAPHKCHTIVKPAPPSLLLDPTIAVQCWVDCSFVSPMLCRSATFHCITLYVHLYITL